MGIYTYMHTYICIYIQTYIHPSAYMHTHKQSGVLSQSRHTSRSGRHYIKVCGPKKAEGSAIWNDLILFLPLDTCWANRETGKVWSLSRRGHKPNSWTPSYKFMKAKSLIFFTTFEKGCVANGFGILKKKAFYNKYSFYVFMKKDAAKTAKM